MLKMIKVLIVDDSLTIRKRIAEIVEKDPELTVAGEASNGKKAFELVKSVSPDVIIMDLVMPVMDGMEAIELIMAYHPTPILVHSSADNRGEDYKTIDALSSGALDFIEKTTANWERELIHQVKRAAKIKVVTHLKKRKKQFAPVLSPCMSTHGYNLVVMGASTGGPKVVLDFFCRLPGDFPLPIILVIHMADYFRSSLAGWLNTNSNLDVIIPSDNYKINDKGGIVYMAPEGRHLIVEDGYLRLSSTPLVNFCRPSVDVLFESVSKNDKFRTIGVLLTGMGNDGAIGLKAIKDSGGYTIAQDEKTSIVFGMPKEAIKIGAATIVLPDFEIPNEIMRLVSV